MNLLLLLLLMKNLYIHKHLKHFWSNQQHGKELGMNLLLLLLLMKNLYIHKHLKHFWSNQQHGILFDMTMFLGHILH